MVSKIKSVQIHYLCESLSDVKEVTATSYISTANIFSRTFEVRQLCDGSFDVLVTTIYRDVCKSDKDCK